MYLLQFVVFLKLCKYVVILVFRMVLKEDSYCNLEEKKFVKVLAVAKISFLRRKAMQNFVKEMQKEAKKKMQRILQKY